MAFPVTGYFRITESEGTLTTSYQLITFPKPVYAFTVEHFGNKGEDAIVVDILDGSVGTTNDNFSVRRGCSKTWRSTAAINKIYVKSAGTTIPTAWEIGSTR